MINVSLPPISNIFYTFILVPGDDSSSSTNNYVNEGYVNDGYVN